MDDWRRFDIAHRFPDESKKLVLFILIGPSISRRYLIEIPPWDR